MLTTFKNGRNEKGQTPFEIAILTKERNITRMILKHVVIKRLLTPLTDLNIRNKEGRKNSS